MHSSSLSLHEDFESSDRSRPVNLGRKPSLHSTHSFFGYPRESQTSIHRAFARPSHNHNHLSSTTRSLSSRSLSRHFGSGGGGFGSGGGGGHGGYGYGPGGKSHNRVIGSRQRRQLYRQRLGIGGGGGGNTSGSSSGNGNGSSSSSSSFNSSPSSSSSLLGGLSGIRDFFVSFFSEGSFVGDANDGSDGADDEDFESFVDDACWSWCSGCRCCCCFNGGNGRTGSDEMNTSCFWEGPCFRGGWMADADAGMGTGMEIRNDFDDSDYEEEPVEQEEERGKDRSDVSDSDSDEEARVEAEAEARARARFGRSKSGSGKGKGKGGRSGRSGRGGKSGRMRRNRRRRGSCSQGGFWSICYHRAICGCCRTCCGIPCFLCFLCWLLRRFIRWFCGRCVAGMCWLLVVLIAFHAGTLLLLWVSLGMQTTTVMGGTGTGTGTAGGASFVKTISPETEILRAAEFAELVVRLGDGTDGNWSDFEGLGGLHVNWTWVDETVSRVDESGWLGESVGVMLRDSSVNQSQYVGIVDVLDLMLNLSGDVLQRARDDDAEDEASDSDPLLLLLDEHFRDSALIVSSLRLISACVRISASQANVSDSILAENELSTLRTEVDFLTSFRTLLFPAAGWSDFECEVDDSSSSVSSLLSNDILALVSHVNQSDGKRISVWVFASFLVVLAIGTAISGGCLVSNCVKTERNETRDALVETVYLVADTADCLLTLSYDAKPILALLEKPRVERTFVERYLIEVVRWQQELSRYVPQSAILHQPTGAEMRSLECGSSDEAEREGEDIPWMKGMGLRRRGSMAASKLKNKIRSVETVDSPRSGSDSIDRHRGGFLNAAMRRSKKRKETLAALRARMTGGFKRVEVTILVIELQDFDRISKSKDCRRLLDAHSVWLSEMTRIIRSFGGATTGVNGDSLLCTFNAEVPCPSHQIKACKAALACVREMNHVRSKYQCEQVGLMDINIGVVSSKVICGVTGATNRKNFVLMGKTDEAFALCKLNESYGTQILVDSHVFSAARYPFLFRTIDIIRYCRHSGTKPMGWRGVRKIFQLVKLKSIQRREWMYELQDLEEQDPLRDYNRAWDCFIGNQLDPAVGKMVTFLEANRNDKHASRSLAIFRQVAAAPKVTDSERTGERPDYGRQESISSQLTVCRYCRRVSINVGYVIDSLTQLLDGAPLED